MLAEFAFTPSIFDESAHIDPEVWRDQLRELGSNLFPRTAAWPVMISNLYEGSWHNVALRVLMAIKDPRARVLCENLLQNAASTLVHRPAQGEWPGDDSVAWGRKVDKRTWEGADRPDPYLQAGTRGSVTRVSVPPVHR